MTKSELIKDVSKRTGFTQVDSEKVVNAMLDAITEALAEGDKVTIVGFGTFDVRERSARKGINPRTGEAMNIPASKLPAFKAGKNLKDTVN